MSRYKNQLLKELWNKSKHYFSLTNTYKSAAIDNYYFFDRIKYFSTKCEKILDCGCGSGGLLKYLWRKDAKFYGVDASVLAIALSKKLLRRKNVILKVADIEKLKFRDNYFDLVYSTFVFEHLDDPEKSLDEIIRVTKSEGSIIIVTPNLGSPLNFSTSLISDNVNAIRRAIFRFIKCHIYLFVKPKGLDWEKLEPKFLKNKKYKPDWDAVTAPYMHTLKQYMEKKKIKVIEYSTDLDKQYQFSFEEKQIRLNILKSIRYICEYIGRKNLSPYKYFGQTIFIVGVKE